MKLEISLSSGRSLSLGFFWSSAASGSVYTSLTAVRKQAEKHRSALAKAPIRRQALAPGPRQLHHGLLLLWATDRRPAATTDSYPGCAHDSISVFLLGTFGRGCLAESKGEA